MTSLAPETLMLVALLAPALCALVLPLFDRLPNVREGITLITAATACTAVLMLFPHAMNGEQPELLALSIAPGLSVAFKLEPLGMLFGLVASVLWFANSIYSIGYMRAHHEPRQTTFYVSFAIAFSAVMGVAFAENLFTLFLFYEALTLSTFPLVTHNRDAAAMRSGRLYLLLLLGTSMGFFLPAIIATWLIGGTLSFTEGGILSGIADPLLVGGLLALYAFGIGKAALMPVHFWLPAAMVAPTPVSAFLHAVAVVKAGVFSIVKVVVYVFGLETLTSTGANDWLIFVACTSLLVASTIALMKENLKARLAYSTVSQLAYVVIGAAIATSASVVGSGLQIATHAAAKITLFFCAGAIQVAAHKTEIADMIGIGRKMPITMSAFFVGSLSIIGLPPTGGMWSKWSLAFSAIEAGHLIVAGVLMISSLLSVAYLMPIVARAFFLPLPHSEFETEVKIEEAPLPCLIALCFTAALSVFLFFRADILEALLLQLFAVS
jgi:multicomponent Na+:H+ antiporter subunit D